MKTTIKQLSLVKMFLMLLIFFSMSLTSAYAQPPGTGWGNPKWREEFNGPLNSNTWVRQRDNGFFKKENIQVQNGILKLINKMDGSNSSGGWIETGRLFGDGTPLGKYGYYEARVKVSAQANGQIWPTWWMSGGKPAGGETIEFDMMEYSGFATHGSNNRPTSAHHYQGKRPINGETKTTTPTAGNNRTAFSWHRWGLLWTRTEVSFWYDGQKYLTSKHPEDAATEDSPLSILLTTSPHTIDGQFGGASDTEQPDNPLAANTPRPGQNLPDFMVDYVRFWSGGNPYPGNPNPPTNTNNKVVAMIKKVNNKQFALDGNNGGSNQQNVYLWEYDKNNINQHWEEIPIGNGYFQYKKQDTNFCLDGNNGGQNEQNVYLYECTKAEQNQHWKKVKVGNKFRLEKRQPKNPTFSIDNGIGGSDAQNVKLYESNNQNVNQKWEFIAINSGISRFVNTKSKDQVQNTDVLKSYSNPSYGETTFELNLIKKEPVSLKIIDMSGREVLSVVNKVLEEGKHSFVWATNRVNRGVYIVVLETPTLKHSSKLLVVE